MTTTTPNMNLVLPDVSITAGPQWATLLNAAYALIDSHDHATNNGVKITPAGLNISADLTFAQNNATNLRTVRLFPNNTFTPLVSDRTCLYASGGELYYIDAVGNNVQITLNGTIDVAGAITALSIQDSGFFIQYFGDTTRQFRFNASAIPTATTRILSVPDSGANDTFVTQAASQVLSNKTLTAPIISSINTGAVTFTLPVADGANGEFLKTNGSGTLSFTASATPAATSTTAGTITRYTDWTTYTPTYSAGFGTVTNNSAKYKVVGDSLFIRGYCVTGTVAASLGTISIPGSFTISSAKLPVNNTSGQAGSILGKYGGQSAGVRINSGHVIACPATSTSVVYIGNSIFSTGSTIIATNMTGNLESSLEFSFDIEVPIV